MEIREIPLQHLQDLVSEEALNSGEVVPVTPERVRSQQKNPRAMPGDIVLWVAFSDDCKIIGFAGSLPGWDRINGTRMGWNSCWWVHPDEGRQAALPLMARFLNYWDFRVAFSDMTPHTQEIIGHLNFCHIRKEMLVQHLLRLSAGKVISRVGSAAKLILPLVLASASVINLIQRIRIGMTGRSNKELAYESRDQLDDELYEFVSRHRGRDFSGRSREEFKWIMHYPWLVWGKGSAPAWADKYPFSYKVEHYSIEWAVSRRNGAVTSVMLLSTRDRNLKVLYFFGAGPEDAFLVLRNKIRTDNRIHSVIYAHPALTEGRDLIRPVSLWTRKRPRYTGISSKILDTYPEDLVMQLGDGDSVFT